MKRYFSIVALLLAFSVSAISQEVTVSFTGHLNNTGYCRIDSVAITDLTRNWSETIVYPDTMIVLSTLNGLAMEAAEEGLGQNTPNPFDCETRVELSLSQSENVRMQLLDVFGKIYAEYSGNLNAGAHTFDISAASPQTYVLNAVVGSRSYSIRMVNTGNGCGSSIKYAGGSDGIRAKLESANEFHPGDNMRYVGYASIEGEVVESEAVEHPQSQSEDITLNFIHCFTSYAVIEHTACDSYTWIDGNTYTATTNEPTYTLTNAAGCDSVVTLHLTIARNYTIDEQIACESYTWIDGNTYTANTDEPTITLTNAAGCDSVVNLYLTISCMPVVQTGEPTNITDSTATFSGYIVSDNGHEITERGFVYGRKAGDLSTYVQCDGDSANFSADIVGLKARRRYYYRAYATNSEGTRYGELRSFDTPFTPIIRSASFIPDGNSSCYNYNLVVDSIFYEGATVTSVNDIERVYLNMEHSYFGDLSMLLECPNGQQCLLHAYASSCTMSSLGWHCTTINNPNSKGGGNIHLGLAPDPMTSSDCYYTAGEGYAYNLTPTATTPFGLNGPTTQTTYTDPCGNTETQDVLNSGDYATFESLESLVGCPLNGEWTLYICDHLSLDNGWILEWGVFFDEDLYAPIRGDVSMPTLDLGVDPTSVSRK
ncbi:MAG: hypothetical protein J5709_08540 [Bacteroidales bacterium]|nr:hypothetical protein [Bacteroidales bacterium]